MADAEPTVQPYVPLIPVFNGSDTNTGGDSLTENLNVWYQVCMPSGVLPSPPFVLCIALLEGL